MSDMLRVEPADRRVGHQRGEVGDAMHDRRGVGQRRIGLGRRAHDHDPRPGWIDDAHYSASSIVCRSSASTSLTRLASTSICRPSGVLIVTFRSDRRGWAKNRQRCGQHGQRTAATGRELEQIGDRSELARVRWSIDRLDPARNTGSARSHSCRSAKPLSGVGPSDREFEIH